MLSAKSPLVIFTGGHHTSALAVADKLQSMGTELIWIGHRHSMWGDSSDSVEYREVTARGIPFYDLKAGKFYRTLHPAKLIRIPYGFLQALLLITSFKMRYGTRLKGIFSSGGYLAVPVVISGWMLRLPTITHEQTVSAGWANRLISLFAEKIAVSWPSSLPNYPKNKTILTGLPLRPEIRGLVRHPQESPPIILIMGGKQGSHIINQTVFASLPLLLPHYQIIHQVGSNSVYQDIQTALQFKHKNYSPAKYLSTSELTEILKKCAVVIGRSGAHTVYEMSYLGIPCVFIPIPWSSHQEQLANAKLLSLSHQAIILPQSDLTPDALVSAVSSALKLHPEKVSVPETGLEQVVQLINRQFIHD